LERFDWFHDFSGLSGGFSFFFDERIAWVADFSFLVSWRTIWFRWRIDFPTERIDWFTGTTICEVVDRFTSMGDPFFSVIDSSGRPIGPPSEVEGHPIAVTGPPGEVEGHFGELIGSVIEIDERPGSPIGRPCEVTESVSGSAIAFRRRSIRRPRFLFPILPPVRSR
jgi:hypothetical protein